MPSDPGAVLTLAEAADLLGISASVLERWARDGRIPSEVRPDGERVFRKADLLSRSVRMQEREEDQD